MPKPEFCCGLPYNEYNTKYMQGYRETNRGKCNTISNDYYYRNKDVIRTKKQIYYVTKTEFKRLAMAFDAVST